MIPVRSLVSVNCHAEPFPSIEGEGVVYAYDRETGLYTVVLHKRTDGGPIGRYYVAEQDMTPLEDIKL